MRYFCTYFDHNYLPQGMTLYHSLKETCEQFTLFVLCLSSDCHAILEQENINNIKLVTVDELESFIPTLLEAKKNRSTVEYYFTLSPCLPFYILKKNPDIELITYLDSDLFFLKSPEPVFDEIKDASVAIISHRFSDANKHKEEAGVYNVGWISYRNSGDGLACLDWYKEKCIEWCYDVVEKDRYADQKYLEYFDRHFNGIKVIENKGANLAPWNVDNFTITEKDQSIYVDDDQLIFYHVQGLRHIWGAFYDTGFFQYNAPLSTELKKYVYQPYIKLLKSFKQKYEDKLKEANTNGIREDKSTSNYDFIKKISPALFRFLAFVKRVSIIYKTQTYVNTQKDS